MLTIYPAVFFKEELGFSVSFPDLKGCLTEGDSLEEAMEMAQEVLGLYLVSLEERGILIPIASALSDVSCCNNEFVTLVSTSLEKYRYNSEILTAVV